MIVADDHPLILEGIRNALGPEVDLLGVVDDGRALVAAVQELQPDVALLDISMPGMGGIEAARQLKKKTPNVKVIFVTIHGDPGYVREALRIGADGYVLKRSAVSELVTAIEDVLRGKTYISPAIQLPSQRPGLRGETRVAKKLTHRQREVLQLIAEGNTAKQIGTILGVTQKTAEFHKAAIMTKLGLHTIADLTKYAVRHRVTERE